jgi:hypothetical protein
MYVSYALARNIKSDDEELRFSNFTLWCVTPQNIRTRVPEPLRSSARLYNWVYERPYNISVSPSEETAFFGSVYRDFEDTLFLLRLFRVGDLVFFAHGLQQPDRQFLRKYPERVISDYVSMSYYEINQADAGTWETFARGMAGSPVWSSTWFGIARRFFLYGGSKEFSPDWNQIDRIVDYMIALEAALLPEAEGGFLKRRLQKRGATLCPDVPESLLGKFYNIRSSIAHGSLLGGELREALSDMPALESAVRKIMATAALEIPADEEGRLLRLASIFDPSETEREQKAVADFEQVVRRQQRQTVLETLCKKYGVQPSGNKTLKSRVGLIVLAVAFLLALAFLLGRELCPK